MKSRWATALLAAAAFTASLAAPATSPLDAQPPISPAAEAKHISQELFDSFEELSRLVDISYCVGTMNTGVEAPFKCQSFCKQFPHFQLVQTWNTGVTMADSCGYIAVSHDPANPRILLAFRGTYSITNAISDMTFIKQEYEPYPPPGDGDAGNPDACTGCDVHAGFMRSWELTNKIIGDVVKELVQKYPDHKLELVGHSLGGAVAALAGLEFVGRGMNPVVTTFGEPKVGNENLAEFINQRFTPQTYRRVTHEGDPVPLLPLTSMGYMQHEFEYYISAPFLPYTRHDIVLCSGNEDPQCIAQDYVNALAILWAHRDYFHRMGLCVPQDHSFFKWLSAPEETADDNAFGGELRKRDGSIARRSWWSPLDKAWGWLTGEKPENLAEHYAPPVDDGFARVPVPGVDGIPDVDGNVVCITRHQTTAQPTREAPRPSANMPVISVIVPSYGVVVTPHYSTTTSAVETPSSSSTPTSTREGFAESTTSTRISSTTILAEVTESPSTESWTTIATSTSEDISTESSTSSTVLATSTPDLRAAGKNYGIHGDYDLEAPESKKAVYGLAPAFQKEGDQPAAAAVHQEADLSRIRLVGGNGQQRTFVPLNADSSDEEVPAVQHGDSPSRIQVFGGQGRQQMFAPLNDDDSYTKETSATKEESLAQPEIVAVPEAGETATGTAQQEAGQVQVVVATEVATKVVVVTAPAADEPPSDWVVHPDNDAVLVRQPSESDRHDPDTVLIVDPEPPTEIRTQIEKDPSDMELQYTLREEVVVAQYEVVEQKVWTECKDWGPAGRPWKKRVCKHAKKNH